MYANISNVTIPTYVYASCVTLLRFQIHYAPSHEYKITIIIINIITFKYRNTRVAHGKNAKQYATKNIAIVLMIKIKTKNDVIIRHGRPQGRTIIRPYRIYGSLFAFLPGDNTINSL